MLLGATAPVTELGMPLMLRLRSTGASLSFSVYRRRILVARTPRGIVLASSIGGIRSSGAAG
jgi:hypothetical protein